MRTVAAARTADGSWLARLAGGLVWVATCFGALMLLGMALSHPRVKEALEPIPALRPAAASSVRRIVVDDDGRSLWITRLPQRLQCVDLQAGRKLFEQPLPFEMSPAPQMTNDGGHVVCVNSHSELVVHRPGYETPMVLPNSLGIKVDVFAVSGDVVAWTAHDRLQLDSLSGEGPPLAVIDGPWRGCRLAWSPDGTRLLTLYPDGRLMVRDHRDLGLLAESRTQIFSGCHIDWSADGRWAMAYGLTGPIAVWEPDRPEQPPRDLNETFRCAVAISAADRLAVCDLHQQLWLINPQDEADRVLVDRLPALASALTFTPDGERLLVGTLNGDVLCWSLRHQRWEWSLPESEG